MGSKSIPMALITLSCKGFRMQQKREEEGNTTLNHRLSPLPADFTAVSEK